MSSSSVPARGLAAFLGLLLCSCAGSSVGTRVESGGGGPRALREDPQKALAAAREALAADSLDVEAWFRLGFAWQTMGGVREADSARVAFERLLEIQPDHVAGLVHHGLVLEELKQPDEALKQYTRATEVAPNDPLPYINLGSLLYFQYKRTYDAKTALTKALELDPDNADAHFNLGVMFADVNMFSEARVEWEKVLEVTPEGPAHTLARENLDRIRPLLEPRSAAGEEAAGR